ncbi:MAG: hypothetical protein HY897_17355 [Deltaproteobacteria bacterium]|nr:hypothetical protein [Deltaproteobacteria bacterium]
MSDEFRPIYSVWTRRRLAAAALVILAAAGLLSIRDRIPDIVRGRYLPFVGKRYPFPGPVAVAGETAIKVILTAFDTPWGEVVVAQSRARGTDDARLDRAKRVFLDHLRGDRTLVRIFERILVLLPLEPAGLDEVLYQFTVANRYFSAAGLPVRIDAGLGERTIPDGSRKAVFLPTAFRLAGEVRVRTDGTAHRLFLLEKHDHLNISSTSRGRADMESGEGWLLLSDMEWQFESVLEALSAVPPRYNLKAKKGSHRELSSRLAAAISNAYSSDGRIRVRDFLSDNIRSIAVHEGRHLADRGLGRLLLVAAGSRLGRYSEERRNEIATEMRAYLSQLAQAGPELPMVLAGLCEHLLGLAEGERELYGVVAYHVLLMVMGRDEPEGADTAGALIWTIAEALPLSSDEVRSAARRGYESMFGSFEQVDIEDPHGEIARAAALMEKRMAERAAAE